MLLLPSGTVAASRWGWGDGCPLLLTGCILKHVKIFAWKCVILH